MTCPLTLSRVRAGISTEGVLEPGLGPLPPTTLGEQRTKDCQAFLGVAEEVAAVGQEERKERDTSGAVHSALLFAQCRQGWRPLFTSDITRWAPRTPG